MRTASHPVRRAVVLGLGLVSACTESGAHTPMGPASKATPEDARVQVDIFSGRENPAWSLTPADSLGVRDTLKQLSLTNHRQAEPGLGYRGFTVTWTDEARARVYRTGVEYTEGSRTVLYADPGRVLEQRLLAGAKVHLPPDVFNVVESQVQSP